MTRFLQSSMQAMADADFVAYRLLADVGVSSSTLYACTGKQYLFARSNTYSPVGMLGAVSAIQEESDVFPRNVTMYLAAINSANLYEPLREDLFNKPVTIYRAFLDPSNYSVPHTPEIIWVGRIAQVDVQLSDSEYGGHYEILCETIIKKNAKSRYFNKETFQQIDSSDTFGNHMDQIPMFKSLWGQKSTVFNAGGGGSSAPPPGAAPQWTPAWRTPYRP